MVQKFPRSQKLSILLLALGLGWFLHRHVQNLSNADFGEYKVLIGGLASAVAVLSYLFVKDFLAVRALCILALFYSGGIGFGFSPGTLHKAFPRFADLCGDSPFPISWSLALQVALIFPVGFSTSQPELPVSVASFSGAG